jgi:hypothetical protein
MTMRAEEQSAGPKGTCGEGEGFFTQYVSGLFLNI